MQTNNIFRNKHCLRYITSPYLYSAKVFAIDYEISCNCCRNLPFDKVFSSTYFKAYEYIVEIFIWLSVLKFLSLILYSDTVCDSALSIFPEKPKHGIAVVFIVSLYAATQFSITKRRKLHLHFIKSGYKDELEWVVRKEYYFLAFFSLFFTFCILSSFVSILVYSKIKNNNNKIEAFGCSLWISIWLFYISGQIISLLVCGVTTLTLVGRRLIYLSKELAEAGKEQKSFNAFLEALIDSHSDLWEFFQHINDRWGWVLCLIYANFLYVSSFLLYGVIFFNMDLAIRIIALVICVVFLSGSICVSWALSHLTSLFYDNFVSIGRFSDANLSIEYKYKVIDFMKRFEGTPIGFCFAGFFSLKRNFIIKMVSGMYSAFSTLIQLTGVLSHKNCSINTNSTKLR